MDPSLRLAASASACRGRRPLPTVPALALRQRCSLALPPLAASASALPWTPSALALLPQRAPSALAPRPLCSLASPAPAVAASRLGMASAWATQRTRRCSSASKLGSSATPTSRTLTPGLRVRAHGNSQASLPDGRKVLTGRQAELPRVPLPVAPRHAAPLRARCTARPQSSWRRQRLQGQAASRPWTGGRRRAVAAAVAPPGTHARGQSRFNAPRGDDPCWRPRPRRRGPRQWATGQRCHPRRRRPPRRGLLGGVLRVRQPDALW